MKHVQWLGDGPISFPLPGHATVYTFQPKIRNIVDDAVWRALIDPTSGPARPYLSAKRLRVTTPGGGADQQQSAAVSRSFSPAPPQAAAPLDDKVAAENATLKAELAKLQARFAKLSEIDAANEAAAAEAPDESDDEAGDDSGSDEAEAMDLPSTLPDPSSMSVAKLGKLVEDLDSDDLEFLLAAEKSGKNRAGAVDLLKAAIAKASGDED